MGTVLISLSPLYSAAVPFVAEYTPPSKDGALYYSKPFLIILSGCAAGDGQ